MQIIRANKNHVSEPIWNASILVPFSAHVGVKAKYTDSAKPR